MSITKEITLWCDNPECFEWQRFTTMRIRTAEKEISRLGWTIRIIDGKKVHYCEECNEIKELKHA